jgi:hypothetical protein
MAAMEARLVAAMARVMDEKLAAHQKAVALETNAKLASLADAVAKDVAAAVAAAVAASQKQAAASAESKVKQAVREGNQALTAALKAASAAESAKLSAELSDEVAAAVARDVRAPLVAAFRLCFADLLVPALQDATQRMFSQIDAGLDARFAHLPEPTAAAAPAPAVDPKAELGALLEAKQVDEALMKALGARDLALVTWVCKQVDPREMAPLSQTVLICLLQQLGQSLDVDTALKLEWFKMIALCLEKGASEIAAYAPKVVADLQLRIKDFLATDKGRTVRQDCEMLLRLL